MLQARTTCLGSIDCIVVDGGPSPSVAVVMCHGYGASGRDLAGLSAEWIQTIGPGAERFRFVFPEAPHTLEDFGMPDGHAWWPINMTQLLDLVEADRFDELHDKEPPGIIEATERLEETIHAVKEELAGESTPLILGGFSQGAMLTMNTSLRGRLPPPALLFQFSGTLVCHDHWKTSLARLAETRVFQSHGKIDPVLPFSSAEQLRRMLLDGNVDVNFHPFMGQHTIDAESIAITASMIAEIQPSNPHSTD